MTEELEQVREIQKAFEQEFERFADLSLDGIAIGDAEAMLSELSKLVHRIMPHLSGPARDLARRCRELLLERHLASILRPAH